LAEVFVGDAAEDPSRDLGEDRRGIGRELDLETGGKPREPGQLVGSRRDRRSAQTLDAALEVDVAAVALEVARSGQDEIGPADRQRVEHRDRKHSLGALGERPDVRVGGSLVAGDDQEAERVGLGALLVGRGRPRLRDTAPVRRLGQEEGTAPRLVCEAELRGQLGEVGAAARTTARPDQDRAVARAEPVAELALPELAAGLRGRAGGYLRVTSRAYLDDLGAGPAGLAQPEVDDRSALDDGDVAENDDELGVADRGQRRPEGVEAVADLFRQHRRVRTEAPTYEPREGIRLLGRLGAGERDGDTSAGLAQQPLRIVECVLPGSLLEPTAADATKRIDDSVVGVEM